MTDLRIAWRNLFRRPRRTAVLLGAIGVSVAGLLVFCAILDGSVTVWVDSVVDARLGHLQLHREGFRLAHEVSLVLPDDPGLEAALGEAPGVAAWSRRLRCMGLAASPRAAVAVTVVGLDPTAEARVTDLARRVVDGALPARDDGRTVCVGRALARKLRVGLGDKIVLTTRDATGELQGAALRVGGLFRGLGDGLELDQVYVGEVAARALAALPTGFHEYAVRLSSAAARAGEPAVDRAVAALRLRLAGRPVAVESWMELAPAIHQQIGLTWVSMSILFGIVLVTLVFGIVDAFLMAIFERIRELGVLLALGTRPARLFGQLLLEGLMLGVLGCALGAVATVAFLAWPLQHELDLSAWAAGLGKYGFPTVSPMYVTLRSLALVVGATLLACLVATLYPALRAATLRPAQALRHV